MQNAGDQAATAALWLITTRWVVRLIGLVSVVVLARLLLPEDFGLVALAMTYVAIIEGFATFDPSQALIRTSNIDRRLLDSAWTLSLARGVLACLVMVSTASFMADWLGDQRLEAIIYVLSLSFIIQDISNPKFILFEKNLVFSKHSILMISQKIAAFTVSMTIAFVYQSYWAMIFGTITAYFVNMVLSYVFIPYLPRPSLARAREIFSFSGWMSLGAMLSTLSVQLDNFIVSKFLGIEKTGKYYMTQQVSNLTIDNVVSPIHYLSFCSLSKFTDDRAKFTEILMEFIGIFATISLASTIGFALVAQEFALVVLGKNWTDIGFFITILATTFGISAIFGIARPALMALGKTRTIFLNDAIQGLIRTPIFIVGIVYWNLEGAIWGLAAFGVFYCALNYYLLHKAVDLDLNRLLAELARPAISTLAMVVAVFGFERVVEDATSPLVLMIGKVMIGGLVFCTSHYGLWILLRKPAGIELRSFQFLKGRLRAWAK